MVLSSTPPAYSRWNYPGISKTLPYGAFTVTAALPQIVPVQALTYVVPGATP